MKLPPKVARSHERLKAAVLEAVDEKGWRTNFQSSAADCQPITNCVAQAKKAGADYVLAITGESNQALGYDISLELFSTKSGHRQSATSLCDYCEFERLVQNVAHSAVDLLQKADAETISLKKEIQQNKPESELRHTPSLIETPKTDGSASDLPWVTIGVGAVVFGYGAWALSKDGDSKDCSQASGVKNCETYSSKTLGYTMVSLGAAAAIGGVAWKIWGTNSSSTVSLTPNKIAFTTRY